MSYATTLAVAEDVSAGDAALAVLVFVIVLILMLAAGDR